MVTWNWNLATKVNNTYKILTHEHYSTPAFDFRIRSHYKKRLGRKMTPIEYNFTLRTEVEWMIKKLKMSCSLEIPTILWRTLICMTLSKLWQLFIMSQFCFLFKTLHFQNKLSGKVLNKYYLKLLFKILAIYNNLSVWSWLWSKYDTLFWAVYSKIMRHLLDPSQCGSRSI